MKKRTKRNVAKDKFFRSVAGHDAALKPTQNCAHTLDHVSLYARSEKAGRKSGRKKAARRVNAVR